MRLDPATLLPSPLLTTKLLPSPSPTPAGQEGGEQIQVGGKAVALGIPGADALRQMAEIAVPLRRIGGAREAAGAILFLAGDWASYMTGQVLTVDGGAHM